MEIVHKQKNAIIKTAHYQYHKTNHKKDKRLYNKIMKNYEIIRELKQSEKSIVHLVREKGTEQVYVQKVLKGRHEVYEILQSCPHPYLPEIYEVAVSDADTTIIEEYIEGQSPGLRELSGKQFLNIARELCCVLEFIHQKGIIHRDLKPSNILLAGDGHIRLIDFDAARIYKDEQEQDTKLLGTRGYAPPEQYGFAQTDERADIYSLGMTLEQLLDRKAVSPKCRRIIRKCTRLDPDKRYQSVRQVKWAFSRTRRIVWCCAVAFLLIVCAGGTILYRSAFSDGFSAESSDLKVLPAPENPRWDGETGIGQWSNVPESGIADSPLVIYKYKLCRRDTADPPGIEEDVWEKEGGMSGNSPKDIDGVPTYEWSFSPEFWENGYYYFAIAAVGDGVTYADSPYVVSDAFKYTGEDAPIVPAPTGLAWKMVQNESQWVFYATWDNMDDYVDKDRFNVIVHDKNNKYVTNNIWTKEYIMSLGNGGVRIRPEFLTQEDGAYRFAVEVQSSRPNQYKSLIIDSSSPDPVPEEYFSPWYYYSKK